MGLWLRLMRDAYFVMGVDKSSSMEFHDLSQPRVYLMAVSARQTSFTVVFHSSEF